MRIPLNAGELRKFRSCLLDWYDQNRRDLPWRQDADPYRVWVSEIMLQQTRVAAVRDHYARFLQRFPNVRTLAGAREASVLAAWSGLGYYHRARRLHQAAKVIVRHHRGQFPQTAEEWLELPGIGRYTAAAIASIAFGQAVAVVDGNVERVLERVHGEVDRREAAWQRAEEMLDRARPGDFNQAMMELGATICTPRAPQCLLCPLNAWCQSRGAKASQPKAQRKRKHLCYALAQKSDAVWLVQRPANASLMAGMWELPIVPNDRRNGNALIASLRHSITDTDYEVSVVLSSRRETSSLGSEGRWCPPKKWERLPLTGLTRKILRRLPGESGGKPAESN